MELPPEIQEQYKRFFWLWPMEGIHAFDPETEARIAVSHGRSKYYRETRRFFVQAPNGDSHNSLKYEGEAKEYSTVFTLNASSWEEAIEKANKMFPKKFEKFTREVQEYLCKKEAGELKETLSDWTPWGYFPGRSKQT